MGILIGDNVDKLKDVNIIVAAATSGATQQQLTVVRGEIQVRRGHWQKPANDNSPSVALIIPVPPGAKLLQPFEANPAVEVSHKCFPSTQKKVFDDDEDDEDDPEAKQAKEDPKVKLAHEKKQVAACFTSSLATSNGREDLSKFLTTLYTPSIDHILYAYYQQCHYVIVSWKQIGDIPESIAPTDCLLDFQISYLQPITDNILVAPAISFSPTQYQKAAPAPHSRHTPKPRRRVSITSAEGHDADAEDLEQQAALAAVRAEHKDAPTIVRRTSDDPVHHESMAASEDMTAIFDHRIYSVNCVRDDGGKNPEELLENMQYRFASGSFVDIVNASAEYSQVAALLNEQLARAGSDAKMPVTDASCYRIKRIVGLHPHEDQRMALAM